MYASPLAIERIIGYFSLISTGWLLFLSKQHRHQITHPRGRKIGLESQHRTTELESSTGATQQKSPRSLELTKKNKAEGLSLNTLLDQGAEAGGWGAQVKLFRAARPYWCTLALAIFT